MFNFRALRQYGLVIDLDYFSSLVIERCHLPQKLKQAGTLRTQLRTSQKAAVLKLGLLLSQQGSLTK